LSSVEAAIEAGREALYHECFPTDTHTQGDTMQPSVNRPARTLLATLITLGLTTSLAARADLFGMELGSDSKNNNGNVVSGGAGPDGAQGASSQLEKCDKPYGTLAVSEPQDYVGRALMGVGLTSPVPLIRMIIQQSNCFMVVERGRAMQNLMQERDLASSGQLRRNANMGGGQMMTADYVLTPDVAISNKDAGGIGGLLGSRLGIGGALLSAGLKFKEAQTSMMLADTRSSLQVASAQGTAKKTDFSLGALGFGGGVVGGLGAYENTAEGKVIAASFLDNWNNIVRNIRNNPQLQRTAGDLKSESGKVVTADGWAEGDVLVTKIGNVKLFATPGNNGRVVATMGRGEEVVFMGKEDGGSVFVQGGSGEGWVSKNLLKRN
jgi:curli biogenesis system outer membrane secretion channel CsgG